MGTITSVLAAASPLGAEPTLVASIPSPSTNRLGPLNMYGLMIALGVIAAVEVGRARWRARGGNPDDVYSIAFWAVPAGLIGARLYHVITDWSRLYADNPGDIVKIWNGGLGIPGGIIAGIGVGVWVAYRRGWRLGVGLDALVPGIALAQAIGRIGNWWNQEVFGGPTSLPWGLEIDPVHRPDQYIGSATFHPTFLYELLWNLALFAVLVLIDRTRRLRPGNILPLYIGGYFLGRLWIEALRVDTASEILGVRVNIWLSIIGIGGAVVALVARGLWRRPDDSDEPYRDGHRWADPRIDPAADPDGAAGGTAAAPDAEADPDVDTEVDASTGEPGDDQASSDDDADGPAGAEVSGDRAEGPPPT
jgi:prolipoprotein diacylglyceryl transferase